MPSKRVQLRAGTFAALGLVVCACLTFSVGTFALSAPGTLDVPVSTDPTSYCLRLKRTASSVVVLLPVGSPLRLVSLLVRLDQIVDTPTKATSIFADEILQSSTLQCDSNRTCTDTVLLTTDVTGTQASFVASFTYDSVLLNDYTKETTAGTDGRFLLQQGYFYQITRTHLCIRNSTLDDRFDGFDVVSGVFDTDGINVASSELNGVFAESPAAVCPNATVDVFPAESMNERTWLAVNNDVLYETLAAELPLRRSVVEQGTACAPPSHAKRLYELDCGLDAAIPCRTMPSLPFRRLADCDIKIRVDSDGFVKLGARRRVAMSRIGGGSDGTAFFAGLRLVVLLIVAFVVYNRRAKTSSSAFSTIDTALRVANGAHHDSQGANSRLDVWVDAAVGILAVSARIVVLVHQADAFIDDGHTGVVVCESVGVACSGLHFILRNFVLKTNLKSETPLTKLGGTMSICDASAAALVSVATTPLLLSTTGDFNAVARLFCAVLVSLFVWSRAFLAVSACSLLGTTTGTDPAHDPMYSVLLWSSALLWLGQAGSVAFSLARLYAVPQAFALLRFSALPSHVAELAVLLASFALATPTLNGVSARLARGRIAED